MVMKSFEYSFIFYKAELVAEFVFMVQTSHDQLISCVLPLLVRAYNDTDVRIQEEVLRRTVTLAKQLDTQVIHGRNYPISIELLWFKES